MLDILYTFIDVFMHIDKHLDNIVLNYGAWTYGILFLVVFCETGLVITPFLPGDSLLFAAGALASRQLLNVHAIAILLFVAAVVGDALNYAVGHFAGPRAFKDGDPGFLRRYFLKKKYMEKTQAFYDKYGAKTIVIARFVPIVRTFAPFLAGIGTMTYPRFAAYNLTGALFWVGLFVYGGYFFGALPVVQRNFQFVVLAIILISVMPIVIEVIKAKIETRKALAQAKH